jgi:hypothetical protein
MTNLMADCDQFFEKKGVKILDWDSIIIMLCKQVENETNEPFS